MLAVFKKDFRAFFTGVIGWIFISAILFLYGLYFFVYNLLSGYPYVSYTLAALEFLIILIVPVLTMRSIAEEKHSKTDQMLLTYPVSLWKVVVGKFMAMAAVFTIAMAIISVTPLVLGLYGTVPMGESYTAILGFWLYGLAGIAVGELISSLTESQIIAAVLSFVALFVGYMMINFCELISSTGNILTTILKSYDFYSRIGPFMAGTLDLGCVLYFVTIIALSLFLTTQVIQKRRYSVSAHGIKLGAFSIGLIIIVIAVACLANVAFAKIPSEYTSIDVTYSKMFSLTDQTKDYIRNLDEDVTIYAWTQRDGADTSLVETLDRYDSLSNHLQVKYISPTESPQFYTAYADESPESNSLFVVSSKRSKVINYEDIYVRSIDYNTYSTVIDGYDAEGQITSAIEYVIMDDINLPVVYYLSGHEEYEFSSSFEKAVEKLNIETKTFSLISEEAVPEDAQMVIINAPMADISKDDLTKLETYLTNGGTVFVTTSYDGIDQTNLNTLFNDYGITKCEGIVVDSNSQYVYSNVPYYLLPKLINNTYTQDIDNGYVFVPFASGLKIDEESTAYDYQCMMVTSDKALSKTNLEGEITTEIQDGDIEGPFYLGVSAMKSDEPGTLIVVGSIDVFNDDADSVVAGSNSKLFTGIIKRHITENEVELPVIESKSYALGNLVITSYTGIIVGLLIMFVIPIALTVVGIVVWAVRRKR